MKNKKLLLSGISLVLIAGLLSSCGGGTNPTTGTTDPTTSSQPTTSSGTSIDDSYKTNEDFEYAKTTFIDDDGVERQLNRNTLYTNAGSPHLDSMEEQHVLVIPFGFDTPTTNELQTPERLDQIETTFFGTQEEIEEVGGWMSVKSYYNTSSYGKATFDGRMPASWCIYDKSPQALLSAGGGSAAAEYGVKWYAAEYEKENHGALGADAEPLSYFDHNKDGYIDLVWVVYSQPTGNPGDFWAYVTYTNNQPGSTYRPEVKTLGFASIDWMDKKYNGYDPHTFIHETGHTYGLDDYYCYNDGWSPFGKIDMMDANTGDHSAYSKFSLGWTNPLVVDDSAIITLRSSTLTGDCFVIPSPGYNNTAFDEYLMVELVTPEGINENDYISGYLGSPGYTTPGIRVSHVDARVYNSESTRNGYLTDNPEDGLDLRIGNSRGGRMSIKSDGDYWPDAQYSETGKYMAHLTLIESSFDPTNNPLTSKTYTASNSSLFKAGERLSFTAGGWAETFMPSGTNLWNKAKTITDWNGNKQGFTVDETCTIDYTLRVLSIEKIDGEYVAQVRVDKK